MDGKFIQLHHLQLFEENLRSKYVRKDEPTVVVLDQTYIHKETGEVVWCFDADRLYYLVDDSAIIKFTDLTEDESTGELILEYDYSEEEQEDAAVIDGMNNDPDFI